jgi:hypothetical protein
MTNMIKPEIIQTAEHLAKQEHSVLLIVILIIIGTTFALVLRAVAKYFIRQYDALIVDHKEARTSYHESLKSLVVENHGIMKDLGVHTARNTDALNMFSNELKLFRETILPEMPIGIPKRTKE